MKEPFYYSIKDLGIKVGVDDLDKMSKFLVNILEPSYCGYYYILTKVSYEYFGFLKNNNLYWLHSKIKNTKDFTDKIYHLDISSSKENRKLGEELIKKYPNSTLIDYRENSPKRKFISIKKL